MAIFILGPDPNGECCGCEGRASPCDTCGEPVYGCALFIPIFSEYASYTEAADVIGLNIPYEWAVCYGYYLAYEETTITSLSVGSSITNVININAASTGTNGIDALWISVTVSEGTVLQFVYSANFNSFPIGDPHIIVTIYQDGTVIDSYTEPGETGSFSISSLPEGIYYISIATNALAAPPISANVDVDITATTGDVILNPVVARYDDSGTTRQLEACPKFLLPPVIPSEGGWYADESAAQEVLDDPLMVSNCIGYSENNPSAPFTEFSATGGSSLTFVASGFGVSGNTGLMFGSINAIEGATVTLTGAGDVEFVHLAVYDYDGNIVFSEFIFSNTITSSALPYTGKYTISALAARPPFGSSSISVTVTSSSTMSTNPIQALYATTPLLECPGRLNC